MRVIDPGHWYDLASLDGECVQTLMFVKREGEKYPGNVGSHPGTTCQDVIRCLIDRLQYVNNQIPCRETENAIQNLKYAIYWLERRAAIRHGREADTLTTDKAVYGDTCHKCGHIGCKGECHP